MKFFAQLAIGMHAFISRKRVPLLIFLSSYLDTCGGKKEGSVSGTLDLTVDSVDNACDVVEDTSCSDVGHIVEVKNDGLTCAKAVSDLSSLAELLGANYLHLKGSGSYGCFFCFYGNIIFKVHLFVLHFKFIIKNLVFFHCAGPKISAAVTAFGAPRG